MGYCNLQLMLLVYFFLQFCFGLFLEYLVSFDVGNLCLLTSLEQKMYAYQFVCSKCYKKHQNVYYLYLSVSIMQISFSPFFELNMLFLKECNPFFVHYFFTISYCSFLFGEIMTMAKNIKLICTSGSVFSLIISNLNFYCSTTSCRWL